jgi:hypothetical protein
VEFIHEAAVAVSAVKLVGSSKLSHGQLVTSRLSAWSAVEAGPVNAQHFGKVLYPTRLDLD